MNAQRKKLIEVALPLDSINRTSKREKQLNHGHPNTLHLWWARRPLAAARAVIFAQMVDDPSSWPDLFPSEKAQEKERQRLFGIIENLIQWENTQNEEVLSIARDEVWRSWRRACSENVDHPQSKELFDRDKLPGFHDPFAGGGALPLEAERLGLEAYASDLNPIAVLINKAMIEIPPKFAGRPPVNPLTSQGKTEWTGAQGLAEDVRCYGKWIRDEAAERLSELYPKYEISAETIGGRPELEPLLGSELTVIGWFWARTVKSPNPAFRNVDVPLASTFMLATKPGTEAHVVPILSSNDYSFTVKSGLPSDSQLASGTKLGRANFACLMSGTPITAGYIKAEAKAGRMGARMMAVVAESELGRVYLPPTPEHETAAASAKPSWRPEGEIATRMTGGNCTPYGLTSWGDIFTTRQLTMLGTVSSLVTEARNRVLKDAIAAGWDSNRASLNEGGDGAKAYADAVSVYLSFMVSRMADRHSSLCRWQPNPTGYAPKVANTFGRQALPMVWDYVEANPLGNSSGNLGDAASWIVKVILTALPAIGRGQATQVDAQKQSMSAGKVVSTDPPYYDNIGYADLSDFFYVWLRPSMRDVFPGLFATLAVPKAEELVASTSRHGGREKAEHFFLDGMTQAMHRLAKLAHPAFPVTIYYAFKQSEGETEQGRTSTGWETFLGAVIQAGFALTGTWPIRTEMQTRQVAMNTNALASSIVLVCRQRPNEAPTATKRDFLTVLQSELPRAIADLQKGNVAPVDMQQAAIGPGMAVFTRYARVLDSDGQPVSVREALAMINQALDEVLAKQEGDFDADTRWAVTWFEQFGFAEGEYGVAETLATARNISVNGIVEAGIARSGRSKVKLLSPEELPVDWTPEGDKRLTAWDVVHHLIRVLEQGEDKAAELVARLGQKAEVARELAYRLYSISDRKKRTQEAQQYNALVQSWPEIIRLSQEMPSRPQELQQSFEGMQ